MKKTILACAAFIALCQSLPVVTFAEVLSENPQITQEETENTSSDEKLEEDTGAEEETSESSGNEEEDSSTEDSNNPTTEEPPTEPQEPNTQPEVENPVSEPQLPPVNQTPSEQINKPHTETGTSNEVINEVQNNTYMGSSHLVKTPIIYRFTQNSTTEGFIKKIGEAARKIAKENDLFASVMIAQAILESGSGSSQLSQEPNNNLFGIKGSYQNQSVVYGTWEDDSNGNSYNTDASFRVYPTINESLEDYSKLLKGGIDSNKMFYKAVWKSIAQTYQNATQALTGTYATDTNYNSKLNALIETYSLTRYDQELGNIDILEIGPEIKSDFSPYSGVDFGAYIAGNCTRYAHNRMTEVSGKDFSRSLGDAASWASNAAQQGYAVTNQPTTGAVVVFPPGVFGADGKYGHVAFCEYVFEDGSVYISEMNALETDPITGINNGFNKVTYRVVPAHIAKMVSYIK